MLNEQKIEVPPVVRNADYSSTQERTTELESIRAQILEGDEVILDGVDVWINETQGPSLKRWDGHFDLDQPSVALMSGTFRLVLADGRSGDFFVTNTSTGSNSETGVDFQGTGPLQ